MSSAAAAAVVSEKKMYGGTCWEYTVMIPDRVIYVHVTDVLPAGSKDGFLQLLDRAELDFACKECIVCISPTCPRRMSVIRAFMYMGFTFMPLPPPQKLYEREYAFLRYQIG